MLTIFSLPKAFSGDSGIAQTNAVESWRRFGADVEILLFGDDAGVAEAAEHLGARHLPRIRRNAFGTPLISDVFSTAEEVARHDLLAYVNADIILLPDTWTAIRMAERAFPRFMLVGRRTNLNINEALDFSSGWDRQLRQRAQARGSLHRYHGTDYFIYRRPLLDAMPDFAIGRTAWDNWIMLHARRTRTPLVDATERLLAVHQEHGYDHVRGHTGGGKGPEAALNRQLAGGPEAIFTTYDATHLLKGNRVASTYTPRHLARHLRARGERLGIRWLERHPRVFRVLAAAKRASAVTLQKVVRPSRGARSRG